MFEIESSTPAALAAVALQCLRRRLSAAINLSLAVTAFFLGYACTVRAQCATGTSNGHIAITGYTGDEEAVTIPSTINGLPVTTIGVAAFENCRLTSVLIPNSVTSIGDYAFANCAALSSVAIPEA